MKNESKDIELLIEYMALVSKYGKKRIEKVIELLNNNEAVEKTITILNDSIDLLNIDTKYQNKKEDIIEKNENEIIAESIIKLLKDKSIFKSLKDLDIIIEKYTAKGIETNKRSDKLKIFYIYICQFETQKLNQIYDELRTMVQEKRMVKYNEESDFNKWSDIIIRNKN